MDPHQDTLIMTIEKPCINKNPENDIFFALSLGAISAGALWALAPKVTILKIPTPSMSQLVTMGGLQSIGHIGVLTAYYKFVAEGTAEAESKPLQKVIKTVFVAIFTALPILALSMCPIKSRLPSQIGLDLTSSLAATLVNGIGCGILFGRFIKYLDLKRSMSLSFANCLLFGDILGLIICAQPFLLLYR